MDVVGVVVAAGESKRAGGSKALFELDSETLIERAIGTLLRAGVKEVCIVVGPPHAAEIRGQVSGVTFLENQDPSRGMFSSVQIAAAHVLAQQDVKGMVLSLLDHPRVAPDTVRALVDSAKAGADAVRPVRRGQRGHPIYLSRPALKAVSKADPKARLSDIVRELPTILDVDVDDEGVLDDLDTAIELLQAGARTPD